MISLLSKIFGSSNDRFLKKYNAHVSKINSLEENYEKITDDELKMQTELFRKRLDSGETLDDILHEAFAVVREAGKRALNMRHFDVQLIGGMSLNDGYISEMRTGEGKTLVATLPAYLNAISGKGVHIVTVNDYLASRDSAWMSQLFAALGLTTGCIVSNMSDADRKKAYACDITYGTNNEFGFDYLRDNMKYRIEDMAQRPFNFAVVDEVDSILIDEARTPLIISGPSESSVDLYTSVDKLVPLLKEEHFELSEKDRTVLFTEEGTEFVEEQFQIMGLLTEGSLYDPQNITLVHHANQALRAHKLFAAEKDYIVKGGKVIIIDEFTGRMMDGRRFSDGLHQALEAKENVEIQNENQTLASITFQNYFRMYPKLSGMTGTALTEATEFAEIYNLSVVSIPTNVAVTRVDHDDQIFKTFNEKLEAIVTTIEHAHANNQPVLVGTVSIEKSEALSQFLKKRKIVHQVLNAKYHEQEAYIIAQAGRPGAVTIATNMAGRGTDIKLGGSVDLLLAQEIPDDATDEVRKKLTRKIIDAHKEEERIVREAGGLCVIGSERHESRRIDNQLRGRSGRQGDPGDTYFYLSLEDDLMRIFSPETLERVLSNKAIGLKDGEALTHPWLSKALEKSQGRVERQNFEIRKNLLKFDNVMNDQRKIIYEQRREIMEDEAVDELVSDMRHTVIEDLIAKHIPPNAYAEKWDVDGLKLEVQRVLNLDLPIDAWAKEEGIADQEILDRVIDESDKLIARKVADVTPEIFRQVEKSMVLQVLDQQWKEHLLNLDHLRQGINLRAFGQRDPLNEFKAEAFSMFEAMIDVMRETVSQNVSMVEFNIDPAVLQKFNSQIEQINNKGQMRTRQEPGVEEQGSVLRTGTGSVVGRTSSTAQFDPDDQSTWGRVQRNAPCPCASGKKYKQCHGKIS